MRVTLFCFVMLVTFPATADEGAGSGPDSKLKSAVDYRHPKRDYTPVSGAFRIQVEKPLTDTNPVLAQRAIAKLEQTLTHIFEQFPEKSRATLAGIKFFLLWGTKSPQGGRASGMSYIRKGEPGNYPHLDRRWEHAIVIYSVDNFMYLDDLWARKALAHELAHGWHLTQWPDKYPKIVDPWRRARDEKRYQNILDNKGKVLTAAYANKNHREYFAELSAMYFVGGNYQPFNRQGLKNFDPVGYVMVESLWGVDAALRSGRSD